MLKKYFGNDSYADIIKDVEYLIKNDVNGQEVIGLHSKMKSCISNTGFSFFAMLSSFPLFFDNSGIMLVIANLFFSILFGYNLFTLIFFYQKNYKPITNLFERIYQRMSEKETSESLYQEFLIFADEHDLQNNEITDVSRQFFTPESLYFNINRKTIYYTTASVSSLVDFFKNVDKMKDNDDF